jgi:hypothetical protein
VNYNFYDEYRDYYVTDDGMKQDHIFRYIQLVDNWLKTTETRKEISK